MKFEIIVLACAGALACGGSPVGPTASEPLALERRIETAAFEYRFSGSDSVDVAWQEAYHVWATAALGVAPRRIVYNKYLSRQHMAEHTGIGNTNAYADPQRYEIHTLWARDNHEVVHLYSLEWGFPSALWTEGLAVAYQVDPQGADLVPRWNRVALHDHARHFLAQGRLVPIRELLTTSGFRRQDSNLAYPVAGSFMQYLLGTCGLEGIKRLYRSGGPDDSVDSLRAQFEAACGRSIEDVESAWRAMLQNGGAS